MWFKIHWILQRPNQLSEPSDLDLCTLEIMNDSQVATKKESSVNKRKAKICAIAIVALAILALALCIHVFFNSNYLKTGSAFNADLVNDMRMIIKVATFIVIPGLSILLILSSRLIWQLCKEIGNDS
jgi:hypothetical protein